MLAEDGKTLPNPELLISMGPVIPVTLHLPDQSQQALVDRGEQPPAPVSGFALIDTGAVTTCFDVDAARNAHLPEIGAATMTSATHANHLVPTFSGKIVCPTIAIDVPEGMGANLAAQGNDLIALIGPDVLQSAVFVYNGPDGHFSLSL